MNLLENLPPRLMTELQIKTQKKLMKMQKTGTMSSPTKPTEFKPPPIKKVSDCLTIELKQHVPHLFIKESRSLRPASSSGHPPQNIEIPSKFPRLWRNFQKIRIHLRRIRNHSTTRQVITRRPTQKYRWIQWLRNRRSRQEILHQTDDTHRPLQPLQQITHNSTINSNKTRWVSFLHPRFPPLTTLTQ